MADVCYKRYEKSLGLLTTRFVSLVKKAKDGVLDLKVVSSRRLCRPSCIYMFWARILNVIYLFY